MYAWENLSRRGIIYIKFPSPTSTARDGREKKKLPGEHTVRDERGRIDKNLVASVADAVRQIAARLTLGEDPFAAPADPAPDVITIRHVFSMALDLQDGKFPEMTRRYDELRRAQRKLERILGANTPIERALEPAQIRRIWRTLAGEYKNLKDTQNPCGARQTEVTVDALYSISSWLEDEDRLPFEVKRVKQWRQALKQDWKLITGEDAEPAEEDKPRHSEDEMRRLFAALGDPRRRVFRALQCTVPEGALAESRWSGLTFDQHGLPLALTVTWQRRVRSKGVQKANWDSRSFTQTFSLSDRQGRLISEALSGYLRLLEAARTSGIINDFPLFPDGPLIDGAISARAIEALTLSRTSVLSVDERFELAFHLGGEQRLGQVIRSTRRKLTLPGIDRTATSRTPQYGVLEPPAARKKNTHPIALTEFQHSWLIDVLEHGYLREFEAAYRHGRIRDYPLFPSERMTRGLAKLRENPQPLTRDAVLKKFRQLEAVAGVESVAGRGWYGVRRIAADLVEDVEVDERVQDAVMANSKDVRRRRYQERFRAPILEQAIAVRERIRGGEVSPERPPAEPESVIAALQELGIELPTKTAAALSLLLGQSQAESIGSDDE